MVFQNFVVKLIRHQHLDEILKHLMSRLNLIHVDNISLFQIRQNSCLSSQNIKVLYR